MDYRLYQRGEDNYRFLRTTCGLVGFIIFFLGAFCAFIVAGEIEDHYELLIILGSVMLFITALFFCCIIHEVKKARILTGPSADMELTPIMPQPKPASPVEAQPEQQEPGWPSGDSDATADFENDSDPDMKALLKMVKSGGKEIIDQISKCTEAKDSTNSEGESTDFESDSTKAGPSNVADRRSEVIESKSEISALKGQSTLSKSDSAIVESASVEKQTENATVLRKVSSDDPKKQAAKADKQGPSSTQSAKTSKDAKVVKSTKSE